MKKHQIVNVIEFLESNKAEGNILDFLHHYLNMGELLFR